MITIIDYNRSTKALTYSENDEDIEFENYEQFVNKMLELDSVTNDEKDVLEQTLSMEKNATWNME